MTTCLKLQNWLVAESELGFNYLIHWVSALYSKPTHPIIAEGCFFPHPITLNNVILNNLKKLTDSKPLWMCIKQKNPL